MSKNPLTIRGLDVAVIDRLKARARRRSRSLEAELREILTRAADEPLVLDAVAEADRIAALTPPRLPLTGSFTQLETGKSR